jgi:RND family efflux transporter MFP subunit
MFNSPDTEKNVALIKGRLCMARLTLSIILAVFALTLTGCARNEAAPAPPPAPQVSVAQVLSRDVTELDEFTGRFQAVERVEIKPRVSGYIASVNFAEGSEVKKDDVLFVIDARPYDAELKRAKAELARAAAQRALSRSERERAVKLLDQHAISREEFDTRVAGNEQADANVQAAEAAVETAQLNMTFTRVRSPISGLVSRATITTGNLVTSGETLLTTVVSLDPIYVEFEGDERIVLKYAATARKTPLPVWVGLADETDTPHQSKLVFLDNELNPETGTIRARSRLSNADRRFTPGLFARVKLAGGDPHSALLVNDSAVGTDQGVKYVFAVGRDNKVEYRPVKLGPIVDGLRVVREGINPSDVIVVNGLQRVRPGVTITPQRVAMGPTQSNSKDDARLYAASERSQR